MDVYSRKIKVHRITFKEQKLNSLDKLMRNMEKKYGEGSLMKSSSDAPTNIERIPVSSPKIGDVLGRGGLPRGRVLELFGVESGGKTSLSCYLAGQVQQWYNEEKQRQGRVAFIDAEHALDIEYAQTFGFNTSEALIAQPNSGEQALDIAIDLAESGEVDFIVIDSVAALTPKSELEGEMGDQQMGAQARMMGKGLRKITTILSESKCTLLFINQVRMTMGGYGNPETTSGGKALKFFASIRLEIRKIEFMNAKNEVIGLRSRLKGVKNKTAPPMRKHEIEFYFGEGINSDLEWVDFAIQYGVIQKGGAWFSLPNVEDKFQGKNKVVEYLKDHPEEYNSIIAETKKRMYPVVKNSDRDQVITEEVEDEDFEES